MTPQYPAANRFLLSAVVVAATCSTASAHPFHVTIAEAEWNPKTKSLEVSMRVNPLDVERMLRSKLKKSVELTEGDKKLEAQLFEYVQKQIVLLADEDKVMKPKWVGMEVAVNKAWLYFEYPMANPPRQLRIQHRVFHELELDQVNTLVLKVEGRRVTRHFTRHKDRHDIPFVAKSASEKPKKAVVKAD